MYNIQIEESWVQRREPGSFISPRRVKLTLKTELPFVPVIGMYWEDESKSIGLPVDELLWSGDYNTFIVRRNVSNANREELDSFIESARETGWEVTEYP